MKRTPAEKIAFEKEFDRCVREGGLPKEKNYVGAYFDENRKLIIPGKDS